jgi:hypothetical protein|tara:strand:- start:21211 stop:21486 length:276 start_codon:yes stop_codon:yes gene_type:complete
MGLTINNFPVIDGLTSIDNVYVNIRNIRYTKLDDGYFLEFLCNYSKDSKHIITLILNTHFIEFYNENIWEKAYLCLKSDLDNKNFTYQDVL